MFRGKLENVLLDSGHFEIFDFRQVVALDYDAGVVLVAASGRGFEKLPVY